MPGRIPADIVDRIRESTDIVDLISEYVKLDKKGGNYFGLCPFHPEKTPSFSVHPGKQIFHCFGCGIGGNAFTFLQEHDKLSFAEAARELAQRAGITIPEDKQEPQQTDRFDALYAANDFACDYYQRCLWEGKGEEYDKARAYVEDRGIGQDLARSFKIGYAPDRWDGLIAGIKKFGQKGPSMRDFVDAGLLQTKESRHFDRFRGRLMFPIFNLSGRPVGFGGRTLKGEEEKAKYINTQQTPIYDKSNILYGMHLAREQARRRGECLIVEGYMDLIRMYEGGFTHTVASSGTALTEQQARLLRRFCQKVILVFDGDLAGSHAALRGGDVLLAAGLNARVIGLPEGQDPDSFIREKGPGAFGELLEQAQDMISFRIELYRREGRLTDVASRSEVARELLSTIAVIPDSIRQEMTAIEAAKKIGVSETGLLSELVLTIQRSRRSEKTGSNGTPFADYPVKEKALVEALIRWPELRGPVFEEIQSNVIRQASLQRIMALMEDAWIKGSATSGEELIGEESKPEDARFISFALSQTESLSDPDVDPKLKRKYDDFITAQDCLRDLAAGKLLQEEEKLKAELLKHHPIERTLKIQGELKTITQKKKEIRGKTFWTIPPHPSTMRPGEEY